MTSILLSRSTFFLQYSDRAVGRIRREGSQVRFRTRFSLPGTDEAFRGIDISVLFEVDWKRCSPGASQGKRQCSEANAGRREACGRARFSRLKFQHLFLRNVSVTDAYDVKLGSLVKKQSHHRPGSEFR